MKADVTFNALHSASALPQMGNSWESCPKIGAHAMIEQEWLAEILRQRYCFAGDGGVGRQNFIYLE